MTSPELDKSASESRHPGKDGKEEDPIAVIGFSLRFPQGATTANSFWEVLSNGRSTMTEWPKDRINIDAFYHADSSRHDTLPLRGGHFLEEDIATFDAPFFSLTPGEAACMDPQQRLLLETSYRALENAGIPSEKCFGSKTSVYIGSFTDDYRAPLTSDPEHEARYASTGLASAMLANRISWFFDFNGPSTQLDSACSSSLTALHIACQGLRNGEASMSLVGGCNLMIHPDFSIRMSNLNFLSHDSRCYSFDERANGYSRGEGFGIVILKPLSDAIRDGDIIRAVIRATGINQDGKTPGITQPNGKAQETLIRDTYKLADLDMSLTRFFEAHGTGTAVGDPIEATAIGKSFQRQRTPEEPLFVGAVKSNIGHLEGASGVAGLIKTVLVLERGMIPPNAEFIRVNPRIDPSFLRIHFPRECLPWPTHGLRRASVNSFGFGGSNAHIVLDDARNYLKLRNIIGNHQTVEQPSSQRSTTISITISERVGGPGERACGRNSKQSPTNLTSTPKLLVWSAGDEDGIQRLSTLYEDYFKKHAIENDCAIFEAVAYTLASRRSSLNWRSFVVASGSSELQSLGSAVSKVVRSSDRRRLGFVFTGQGAQYPRMGQELLSYPVFKESLQCSDSVLKDIGCKWSLIDKLDETESSSPINDPEYSQPVCAALQIALVDLLRAFEILPAVVTAHSSGEIAAAYCVGALSQVSALTVAFHRGALAASLTKSARPPGAMLSVGLSEQDARYYLDRLSGIRETVDVVVGCVNSPKNVTLSGDKTQIELLESWLNEQSVFVRRLKVDVAYHSPRMSDIAAEYLRRIQGLEPGKAPVTPVAMISTVTGLRVLSSELRNGEYWVTNLVSPVRFLQALIEICTPSVNTSTRRLGHPIRHHSIASDLLEIGPHCALKGPVRETFATNTRYSSIRYLPTLVRHTPAARSLLDSAGRLYCSGYPIRLLAVNNFPPNSKIAVDLPEYPFNHSQTHWMESRSSSSYRFRKQGRIDLLGTPQTDWNSSEPQWHNVIKLQTCPWIEDHMINGACIYPAAGMLVMAIEAAKQVAETDRLITGFQIKDATFFKALNVSLQPQGVETQLFLRPLREASDKQHIWSEYLVYVYEDGHWVACCRGLIQVVYESESTEIDGGKEELKRARSCEQIVMDGLEACTRSLETNELYDLLRDIGTAYGPTFQVLDRLTYDELGAAAADVKLRQWTEKGEERHAQAHVVHPTTLDGVFQLIFPALAKTRREKVPTMVPTRIHRIWISNTGLSEEGTFPIRAVTHSRFKGYRETESSIFAISGESEAPRIMIEGLETSAVTGSPTSDITRTKRQLCCSLDWKPDLDLMTCEQVLRYCETTRPQEIPPSKFHQDLRLAILFFVSSSLKSLADKDSLRLQPHILNYIDWMKHEVWRCNVGQVSTCHKELIKMETDSRFRSALLERVEHSNTEGRFYVAIGKDLSGILDGDEKLLDQSLGGDLASAFYSERNRAPFCIPFATYLDTLAHKNPAMKILEVQGGRGTATIPILDALTHRNEGEKEFARFSQYDFTDVNSNLFEDAKEHLQRTLYRITFKVLDIAGDPSKQGYQEGTYDVVIASYVLYATQSIVTSLENIRRLLKPGGKLVLFEVTEPQMMRTAFAFGLSKDWWKAANGTQRRSPCLSENAWKDALIKSGYSGLDFVLPDYHDKTCHESSILVTTAVDNTMSAKGLPNIVFIAMDSSPMQQSLAHQLQRRLTTKGKTSLDVVSLQQAAERTDLATQFCIVLLEIGEPFLNAISGEAFVHLQRVIISTAGLLWVTQDIGSSCQRPEFEMVTGFARALRSEYIQLKFVTLALEGQSSVFRSVETILKVLGRTIILEMEEYEPEYREMDGLPNISRVIEADELNCVIHASTSDRQLKVQRFGSGPPLSLCIPTPGLLDSLEFQEDMDVSKPLTADEVEVEVKATGVNFRDCLMALGRLSDDDLGTECAGIVRRVGSAASDFKCGDRITICTLGTYKTFVRCKASCAIKIPDAMPFTEAASLPTASLTAYHALLNVARIRSGESVLIHAGAGGTGQIAIQIAQHMKATVYVTVGSEVKKRLLMSSYGIPEDCIFYSRDTSFAQGIKRITQGRGVDVVLNSLSGESLVASWECVAPFGRFLEIGKKDIASHANLPMFPFAKNVSFAAVDLSGIVRERPSVLQELIQGMMALVEQGKLRAAQPMHVFPASEITKAFRSLQSGKSMGKMVIEFEGDNIVPTLVDTQHTYSFESSSSYLIAGGLGGLGRSIAQWMVDRGARYLILLSRSGPKSDAARALLSELHSRGVHVEAPACDISQVDTLGLVLEQCKKTMPPIKGCIQGTMVLRDTIFERMSHEDYMLSTRPKVSGSWNLHTLLPEGMHFFVLLSSICGIFGATSQVNYASGNTYKDALARYRVTKGEKAVSIDLGMMTAEGVLAENQGLLGLLKRAGFFMEISQVELFALLDHYCNPALGLLTPPRSQVVVGIEKPAVLHSMGMTAPEWMHRPLFRHFHQMNSDGVTRHGISKETPDYGSLIRNAASPVEAAHVISEGLVTTISRVLAIPLSDIDATKPLHSFGVDSLIAVEVRSWLLRELKADIAIFDILGNASISELSATILAKSLYQGSMLSEGLE